jgi:serine/threonine protein kinase
MWQDYRHAGNFREEDGEIIRGIWIGECEGALYVLKWEDPKNPHERKMIEQFNHPHIIRCLGTHEDMPFGGTDPNSADHFMVLEYVDGKNLRDVRKDGPVPEELIVLYGGQIASALMDVHSRNLVHNDVKPKNIVVTPLEAKLVDFELAQTRGTRVPRDRKTKLPHWVAGSFSYICLDQLEGRSFFSNDTFSFGATLFFLITGQSPYPFHGTTDVGSSIRAYASLLKNGPAEKLPRSPLNDVVMGMIEPYACNRPKWGEIIRTLPLRAAPQSSEQGYFVYPQSFVR